MSSIGNIPNSLYPFGTIEDQKPVRVEYITSRDGAYIDTGIQIKDGIAYDITIGSVKEDGYVGVFGKSQDSGIKAKYWRPRFTGITSSAGFSTRKHSFGTLVRNTGRALKSDAVFPATAIRTVNVPIRFYADSVAKEIGLSDDFYGNFVNTSATFSYPTSATNLVLFGYIDNSGNVICEDSRLWNATISEDGVVKKQLVPIKIGNYGYLSDEISETILSSDAGFFEPGPIKKEVEEEQLPYDYELQSLASDGSAYLSIDAPYIPAYCDSIMNLQVDVDNLEMDKSYFACDGRGLAITTYSELRISKFYSTKYGGYGFQISRSSFGGLFDTLDSVSSFNNDGWYRIERDGILSTYGIFRVDNSLSALSVTTCNTLTGNTSFRTAKLNNCTALTASNFAYPEHMYHADIPIQNHIFLFCQWMNNEITDITDTTAIRIGRTSLFYHKDPVLDLIPVVKDGVGYFYDKIKKRMYGNSNSTGAFVLGTPKDFDAEIEYLESTGTQWIDTEFKMTSENMCFESDLMRTSNGGTANFFYGYRFVNSATYIGNMRAFFIYGSNPVGRLAIRYGVAGDNSSLTIPVNQKVSLSFDGQKIYVDGIEYVTVSNSSTLPNYGNMYLFDCNTESYYRNDVSRFIGRIYSFKIWQSNQLVRDFVPVRKGNVGYLYDKISHKLFDNKGTGNFTLGPDKTF